MTTKYVMPVDLMINSVRNHESAEDVLDEMTGMVAVGVELDKPLGLPPTDVKDENPDVLQGIEILKAMTQEKYLDKTE